MAIPDFVNPDVDSLTKPNGVQDLGHNCLPLLRRYFIMCSEISLVSHLGFPLLLAAAPSRRQLTVEKSAEIVQLRKCGARMKRSILPLLPHRSSMSRCFGGCELCVREPDLTRTRAIGIPTRRSTRPEELIQEKNAASIVCIALED